MQDIVDTGKGKNLIKNNSYNLWWPLFYSKEKNYCAKYFSSLKPRPHRLMWIKKSQDGRISWITGNLYKS